MLLFLKLVLTSYDFSSFYADNLTKNNKIKETLIRISETRTLIKHQELQIENKKLIIERLEFRKQNVLNKEHYSLTHEISRKNKEITALQYFIFKNQIEIQRLENLIKEL
ncbi:hypothetical protein GVAV_001800 [Gurleya vavrai]